jgi:hypothetical protein
MDALTNTNAPIAYDPIRYGREIMGIPAGTKIKTDSELGKFIVDQTKKFNERRIEALSAGPQSEPRFMSVTNAEGRVIDLLIKPDGDPIVIEPKTLNTQQGMFTMANPTNAAPIIDPRTGQQVQGYAAGPMMGIDAAPLGTYTPGQPAAPTQTPAPTPMPSAAPAPTPDQQAPQQAQFVRVVSPDGKTGIIPSNQVDQALKQGFQLAP